MKHISNIIDLAKIKQEKENMAEISSETAEVINLLFKELRSNFTAFKQAWPTQKEYVIAKKIWLKAFILAGIKNIEQINHGLNKCYLMPNPFVPSPGQFIEWCKPNPKDFGLPSAQEAFTISCQINEQYSAYIHPHLATDTVIKNVISHIGPNIFRQMATKDAFKLFESYYEIACRNYMTGKLAPIHRALPETTESHPIDKVKSDEARKIAMDELRKLGLNIKTTA